MGEADIPATSYFPSCCFFKERHIEGLQVTFKVKKHLRV